MVPADHYIQLVEQLPSSSLTNDQSGADDTTAYQFAICMLPANSARLHSTQYLQSDIAFQWVSGYFEFELGAWDCAANMSESISLFGY